MNRLVQLPSVLTIAVVLAVLGCSGPSPQAPDASASSSAPTTFDRLGYRLSVPEGWLVQVGYQDWEALQSVPHLGTPAFDTFSSPPGSDGWIIVGKRPVRDAAPLDRWIDQMRAAHLITYEPEECAAVEDQRSATLGGEPAVMASFHCPGGGPHAAGVQVLARHGDSGWVVMCYAEPVHARSLAELEAQCEGWLSSYEFAP